MLKRLTGSLFLALTIFAASSAIGAPRINVHPVKLLGYAGDSLKISFEIPCGGRFQGLLAKASQGKILRLGVAIERERVTCTSMPRLIETTVPFIATAGFREIVPMRKDQGREKLVVVPVRELRTPKGGKTLQAIYQPKCGRTLGAILRQAPSGELKIAMAEHFIAGKRPPRCASHERVVNLPILNLSKIKRVTPLLSKQENISRSFFLKIAKVKKRSLKQKRGLSVVYSKKCNEAPIGFVFSGLLKKRSEKARAKPYVRVGVLVAHFLNHKCKKGAPSKWATLSNKDLKIPKHLRVKLLAPTTKIGKLALSAPTSFSPTKHKRAKGLKISHINSCSKRVGVVYAHDQKGHLSVGVLSKNHSLSCKKLAGEVSLFQPYVSSHVRSTSVFPMRIRGLTSL